MLSVCMIEQLPVEIDRDEKRVIIEDHRRLYRFIKCGGVFTLIPVWEALRTTLKSVEPELAALTRVVEAGFYYHILEYSLRYVDVINVSGETSSVEEPTLTVSVRGPSVSIYD